MTPTRPSLRYHGGKWRLAPWILQHIPAHRCYVEPFGGAAGVLLRKPRSYAEVYNDLDGDIVNLFAVLRDQETRNRLAEQVALTPYARSEFYAAYDDADDAVERARKTVIRASMGFGSAGATKGMTGFRNDSKRAYQTAMHVWLAQPDALRAVGQRFEGVLIENRPALDVIRQHDGSDTLFYVDPPYMMSTRYAGATGGRYYNHEMTDSDHQMLLAALLATQGMVVLSGYPNDLYSETLTDWETVTTDARIAAGRGTAIRTEQLWLNPACSEALHGAGLFAMETPA